MDDMQIASALPGNFNVAALLAQRGHSDHRARTSMQSPTDNFSPWMSAIEKSVLPGMDTVPKMPRLLPPTRRHATASHEIPDRLPGRHHD
jgi:hypothetical protein